MQNIKEYYISVGKEEWNVDSQPTTYEWQDDTAMAKHLNDWSESDGIVKEISLIETSNHV